MPRLAALLLALFVQHGVCAQTHPAASAPAPAPVVARIHLTGPISDQMAAAFEQALAGATEHAAVAVLIVIDSPGGEVDAGRRISRDIENSPVPVTCVVDGEADSMAFYVLQSCSVRAMTARSVLMTHEVVQLIVGPVLFTAEELENLVAATRAESEALFHHCSSRLRVSPAEYKRRTRRGRRWWMTAAEALRVGAVDEVLDSPNGALR
jgi:ATP-dependent protease ClpP protease subunit